MHQFNLGPKAIQEINKIQAVLARFSRKERASIVRYLGQALTATGTVAALSGTGRSVATVRSIRGRHMAPTAKRKLSRVAKGRSRTSSGTFVRALKKVGRTSARARAA